MGALVSVYYFKRAGKCTLTANLSHMMMMTEERRKERREERREERTGQRAHLMALRREPRGASSMKMRKASADRS